MANAGDLQILLDTRIPAGSVTTYGDLSAHFYDGRRGNGQAIGAMLKVCVRNVPDLTHRVVQDWWARSGASRRPLQPAKSTRAGTGAVSAQRPGGPGKVQGRLVGVVVVPRLPGPGA
jgi:alkylated DNA nucleotide flippase Atl1